jgi:phosphoribosylanthranilate isomerase
MHPLRIKVCGVTTPSDVAACADAGADAVGINFYPQSPRYVDPRAARPLLRAIPPFLAGVGVFVDQPLRHMSALAYQLGLRTLQHHGEPPAPEDPFPFQLIVAVRARDRQSLADVETYVERCRAAGHLPAGILIDAYVEGRHGGTGHTARWDLLTDFRPGIPIILAGGLTPDNVAEAVRRVRPAGVDVASGVESAPGRKDPETVRRFVANARDAAAAL